MEKKVAIILLTCNQPKLVEKCLVSIRNKTDYKDYKVYLVDDSGTGEIGKEMGEKFKWIDVSLNKTNLGVPKSVNFGVKKALKKYSPDYFIWLNDDIEFIEKDWLKKMIEVAESDNKIGMLSCKLVYPDGNLQWFFKNGKMNFAQTKNDILETKETFQIKELKEGLFAAVCLIKKQVVAEVGLINGDVKLIDEKFSPLYGDDTDLCYRAVKKGFKLIYVGSTKAIHHGSASAKKSEASGGKWFLQKKHGIRCEWLNFNISKIIKHTIIHFSSVILSKKPVTGLKLLLKAYKENFENLKEIRQKRKERFSWKSM